MKKKILAVLLTVAMVATLAIGCSSGGDSGSEESAGGAAEDMTFVIVPKCVHAWFDEVNKGAEAEAELLSAQLGVEVKIDYRAPEEASVDAQNSTLEQAAATKPNAILMDPVDYDGSADVIDEIRNEQGIPVILFDSPSPEGSGLTSVGNDFAEQAEIAVDLLIENMGTSGKVAVMQGAPSAPNHAERYQAHLDALAEYPDIEVIDGGIDNDNVETAQSQAAAVLAANPDLTGYLNCDACGAGVAAAIEEKGMQDQVTFVSMDNLIEILNYIKSGTIAATSSTLPQEQGMYAVLMAYQTTQGMNLPAMVDTGIARITPDNIDEWIEIVGE